MKKENFKRLFKNIYMGVSTAILLGILVIIIFVITLDIEISQADSTEVLVAFNNPNSFISNIVDFNNLTLKYADAELIAQYPNIKETTLVLTTLEIVLSNFVDYIYMLAFAGVLGGIVYYNIWGKEFELKTSIKKILLNYILIGLITLTILTIYNVIINGTTIYGLYDIYIMTIPSYTMVYLSIFALNYINQKRITEKLNKNL